MKTTMLRGFWLAGALTALGSIPLSAQIVEFHATINAAQETTGSTSTAVGTAVMFYDMATNKFDLMVSISNFTNTISASHIHEGASGVAGGVVTGLGDETVYTRNGSVTTATFSGLTYGGTPLTLLQNGAYFNVHSAAWPGGEVRGQLIAQPLHLYAILSGAEEVPVNTSQAYGAAVISYDPGTNKITTRINIYNYANTFSNSHYHEAAPGVSGPVVHGLGGASAYTKTGNSYGAVFSNQTYLGNPIKLLTGGTYLNAHSNLVPAGEIRGQVHVSNDLDAPRLTNVSARGWVGTGDQVLITGFVITGKEPVRVLVTGKGPSLAASGVSGALADPWLSLHDNFGHEIAVNDNNATTPGAADLAGTGFAPTAAAESALVVVLPPGLYSTVLSGVGNTTGVALMEVYEVKAPKPPASLALQMQGGKRRLLAPASTVRPSTPEPAKALEFCIAAPLALAGKP